MYKHVEIKSILQMYFNEKPGSMKEQTELNSFLVQVLHVYIIMYSIEKEKVI